MPFQLIPPYSLVLEFLFFIQYCVDWCKRIFVPSLTICSLGDKFEYAITRYLFSTKNRYISWDQTSSWSSAIIYHISGFVVIHKASLGKVLTRYTFPSRTDLPQLVVRSSLLVIFHFVDVSHPLFYVFGLWIIDVRFPT